MNRQKQSFIASMIIILIAVISQAGCNPTSNSGASPTPPAEYAPSSTPAIPAINPGDKLQTPLQTLSPAASIGNGLHALFPFFSLSDPNTVCIQHYFNALSCLDATGWHIYEEAPLPRRIVHCTDERIYLVDNEFYQYQIEGDLLVGIGGGVDLGNIACGSGNEIWVSDFSQVMHFDGSTWTNYSVEDNFGSHDDEWPDDVYSLAIAPNGNAWVTTANTIATFAGGVWQIVTPPGNYRFDDSSGRNRHLVIDSNGVVWLIAFPEMCCTDGQLLKFEGSEWSVYPGPEDEFEGVQIIAVDNENRIWAATTGTKIFILNPDTNEWELRFDLTQLGSENEWESRFNGEQLGLGVGDANRINQMEFDRQGRLWVTTDYGLGIYDGMTWTVYHDYTADLYMNEISGLSIFGDGPQLPALKYKPFGSIQGKLVGATQSPLTDALVQICIDTYVGNNICGDKAESINVDGSFEIYNVPAGTYSLRFKLSNEWYDLTIPESGGYGCTPYCVGKFTVEEGKETNLGEIFVDSNANQSSSPIPTQTSIPAANHACIASSGSWSTPPDGGLSIIFTIEDCKISTVLIMGLINGQWLTVSNEANEPINGSAFDFLYNFSDQDKYKLSGAFASPTSASIQLVIFKGFRFTTGQPSQLNEDFIINASATLGKE